MPRSFARAISRWCGAVVAALLLVLTPAGPAAAHDYLIATSPEDGDVLATAPTEIMLEFNNDLVPIAPAIRLTNSAGTLLTEGTPALDGQVATFDLPPLPDDTYVAAWSVVSSDGHRIQGIITFTVGDTPVVAGSASPEPTTPAVPTNGGSVSPLLAALTAVAVVALGAGVAIAKKRGKP